MRLKTILIGVAVLLAVIVGGAVILVMSIDFNQYKGLIAEQVKQATGRELTIAGDFKLSLSLAPAVAVNNVSLANFAGGSPAEMVTLKRLEVQLQLLPLLSREIRVDRLVLDGANVLLETDKNGRGNWELSSGSAAAPAQTSGALEKASATNLPEVGRVEIRNTVVTYRDGITGAIRTFRIDKLDAETKGGRIELDIAALIGKAPVTAKGSIGAPDLLAGGAPYPFDLTVTARDSSAAVKGAIRDVSLMQGIATDISAKGKALSDLEELAGASLPPLGPYGFTGKATDIPGGYQLSGFKLTLGGSSLGGDLALQLAKQPKVTATLVADRIDFKDFEVKPAAAGRASKSPGDGRIFSATPLPLAALGAANADINLAAKEVIREPAFLSNVKLALSVAAGKLQIRPFSAGIGGGTLLANLSLDGAKTPAPLALDLTESNAEAGHLLRILAGTAILSGGRANLKVSVTGAGNSVRTIMAGLSGKLDFAMGSGNINNDFARLLLADLFKLVSFGSSGDSSNLKCVVAHFDINHGLATTNHLAVETSGATILGKGTINLATEGMDIHLVPHATAVDLANLAVPVIIGGTLADPRVVPDAPAIATGAVKMPLTTLGTIASIAGIGGSGDPGAGCGSAAVRAQSTQPASPGGQIQQGIGNGVKGVGNTLKSLLP
jgi:uncharacterized protein involved in outer membrane biogenesis